VGQRRPIQRQVFVEIDAEQELAAMGGASRQRPRLEAEGLGEDPCLLGFQSQTATLRTLRACLASLNPEVVSHRCDNGSYFDTLCLSQSIFITT
jgi:hypothetical protein